MKSSNNNFNLNLNEEQKKAVLHGTGPARVIAGPGSGKTTVIINRILHLITHHKILPEHILVITFTKAAALEMQERFQRSSQEHGYKVTFGKAIIEDCTNINGKVNITGATLKGNCKGF